MTEDKNAARERADRLHAEEEAEYKVAKQLPIGEEQDQHRMRGERLSDEAWSIEEANDLDPTPSGVWPEKKPDQSKD